MRLVEAAKSAATSVDRVQGARALGWVSIGIGLAEIAAPQQVQSLLGLKDRAAHRGVLRVMGVREILHGVSILTENRATPNLAVGLWSRVAGDILDTALLGVAAGKTQHPARFATTAASVMVIGMLDAIFATKVTTGQE